MSPFVLSSLSIFSIFVVCQISGISNAKGSCFGNAASFGKVMRMFIKFSEIDPAATSGFMRENLEEATWKDGVVSLE